MAKGSLQVQYFNDFTGGLNNKQARQSLALNESPDCQDVVFGERGGFVCRRGFKTTTTQLTLDGGYIGGQFNAGTDVLWGITKDGFLWTWNGSTYTAVSTPSPADMTVAVTSAVWGNKLYFANWVNTGSLLMRYWNGTAFTTLGNAANNDYTAPTGGNAPLARLIANHSGHMWWADTVESGTRHRSRVRWSHPLQPEDFAAADYFDIEPDDESDQITALVPFQEMLLVFKRRAVFAIYGYERETFVVQRLSSVAGVACQGAVATNAGVAYWWSIDGNVYAFNGRGIVPIGERITGVVKEGVVASGCLTNRVAWVENQLWVSLRKNDNTRIMFVYDPAVGENGAWTRFSYAPTSMIWWHKSSGAPVMHFTLLAKGGLFDTGNFAQEFDEINTIQTPIPAYYRTAWFFGSDASVLKRWRRPRITFACGDTANLNISVYHNFIESNTVKSFIIPVEIFSSGSLLWDDGTGAIGGDWGDPWSGDDPGYEFERTSSLGRSNSVQLRFEMKQHSTRWWVDGFSLPYFQKSYR
jgi:hypothetical protein